MTEPLTPPEPTPSPAPAATPGAETIVPAEPVPATAGAGIAPGSGATLAMAGAAAGAAGAVAVGAGVATAPTPPRRRRRRMALLIFLLILLGIVALFTGWYFVTRKPISELPIVPPVVAADTPTYGYSVYGVAAPTGVAVNAAGDRIYVAQTGADNVVKVFDAKGTALGDLTPPSSVSGGHIPVYVAVDPATQDVYVSDRLQGAIYVYSSDGVYRRTFDPGKDLKGWQPLGIGFGSDGTMYVTDVSMPQQVHQFAPDGTLVRSLKPTAPFNFPNGAWPDANGNLYVSDSSNGRVRIFAPDGSEVGGVSRGAKENELGLPRGIVIDDQGRVFVADATGQSVQVYKTLASGERSLTFIGKFGEQGSGDGQFQFPNGTAADTHGHVYVTDTANNRVQVWSY